MKTLRSPGALAAPLISNATSASASRPLGTAAGTPRTEPLKQTALAATSARPAKLSPNAPTVVHAGTAAALSFDFDAAAANIRASLAQYVAADTTNPPGNEMRVVDLIADRLRKAGITPQITEFAPGRKNLVATLHGSGEEKPLVLMAHTDVVGTDGQPWSTPPHVLTEKDGVLYGRGSRDDLSMVATNVELFLMLAAGTVPLKRDIILVCAGDEEAHSEGVRDLLKTTPALATAGLVINEGGGVASAVNGGPATYLTYEVGQKTAQDFVLTTTGQAGHSALPRKDNAIARLGRALGRIGKSFREPRLNDIVRAYFKKRAPLEAPLVRDALNAVADAKGELPAGAVAVLDENPLFFAMMRTTFAPTLVAGGIKDNVLPSSATATVNARILPDETIDDAEKWLAGIINDDKVAITRGSPVGSGPASPLEGEFATALRAAATSLWPDAPLLPLMQVGYTDSRYFRQLGIPAYGFNPHPSPEALSQHVHGADEGIPAASLRPGIELYVKLVMLLARSATPSGG